VEESDSEKKGRTATIQSILKRKKNNDQIDSRKGPKKSLPLGCQKKRRGSKRRGEGPTWRTIRDIDSKRKIDERAFPKGVFCMGGGGGEIKQDLSSNKRLGEGREEGKEKPSGRG